MLCIFYHNKKFKNLIYQIGFLKGNQIFMSKLSKFCKNIIRCPGQKNCISLGKNFLEGWVIDWHPFRKHFWPKAFYAKGGAGDYYWEEGSLKSWPCWWQSPVLAWRFLSFCSLSLKMTAFSLLLPSLVFPICHVMMTISACLQLYSVICEWAKNYSAYKLPLVPLISCDFCQLVSLCEFSICMEILWHFSSLHVKTTVT